MPGTLEARKCFEDARATRCAQICARAGLSPRAPRVSPSSIRYKGTPCTVIAARARFTACISRFHIYSTPCPTPPLLGYSHGILRKAHIVLHPRLDGVVFLHLAIRSFQLRDTRNRSVRESTAIARPFILADCFGPVRFSGSTSSYQRPRAQRCAMLHRSLRQTLPFLDLRRPQQCSLLRQHCLQGAVLLS